MAYWLTGLRAGNEPSSATEKYARALGSHDGVSTDDAGHILANRLGGCGTCPINIFPQLPHLNRGAWRSFEADVYDCIHGSSTKATLSWTFTYASTTKTRPSSMVYAASYT